MALTDEQRERLAELKAQQAEQDAKDEEAAEARELEAAELRVALQAKGLVSDDFRIVNNRFGVFALKRPDTKAIRNWDQADGKKKDSVEWQVGLLKHYIIDPQDKELKSGKRGLEWAALAFQRPGLCWQTGNAFVDMMGVDQEAAQKKG